MPSGRLQSAERRRMLPPSAGRDPGLAAGGCMNLRVVSARLALAVAALLLTYPSSAPAQGTGVAPTLIPVSGELRAADGQPRTGQVLLVISLYEGKDDPAPRWIEHQAVTLDAAGRYSLQFGGTRAEGLPADLFAGAAGTRWVGLAVENEPEQPRVALVSVPYAAKAV